MPTNPSLLFCDVISFMSSVLRRALSKFYQLVLHDSPSLPGSGSFYLVPLVSASRSPSAGPPSPAEILPGTAIHIAFRIQRLGTRIFRGIELEDHPLRIRNAGIRRRVQKPDFFVREPKVYGTDVVL